jgi:precorrin-8X/cobalt-precorrin-8 methylmutase
MGTIITTITATGMTSPLPTDPTVLRDPAAIYRRSFALIREALAGYPLPNGIATIARRVVHACGMPEIVADLAWWGDPLAAGRAALAAGAPVLCDARMVAAGIAQDRLPASNAVEVHLADPATTALAERLATTRSAAAVELWRPRLDGAVVAIGNAPTALIHLLDRLREWPERPALILAFPVGFIGAAESKEALIAAELDAPWLTLRGRLGGSAMAAAAVNALFLPEP